MKKNLLFFSFFIMVMHTFGQYSIGRRQINIKDNARLRNINTFVYYPATADSSNAPIVDDGTKFPVIAFGHGFVMSALAYQWLVEALVPYGYIIGFPSTEEGVPPNHSDFGKDEVFVARTLRDYGDSATSFLYQKTSGFSAIGGHSMGGGASFLGMQNVSDITTFFNFAAAETFITESAIQVAKKCTRPALVFGGSKDCVAPVGGNSRYMYQNLKSEYKVFANIINGSHCQFADANKTPCEAGELVACFGTSYVARNTQQSRIIALLKPWLDFWLKRDCNAITSFYNNTTANATTIDTLQSKVIDCNALNVVTNIKQTQSLKAQLFPNPSAGLFTLSINEYYQQATLQLFDITGKSIDTQIFKGQSTIALDYTTLAKGMYQLQLKTENGLYMSKIVIE